MSDFVTVANTNEIPAGEGRAFEVRNRVVAVFNIAGKYSAIDDMCPHMGASLCEGDVDLESCVVSCPWHGWRFNVVDGTWVDNPRIKTDQFEVRIVDDEIQVRVPDPESTSD